MPKGDPTGTTSIQNKFLKDIYGSMLKIVKAIDKLIVQEDAFGLKKKKPFVLNTRYAFETDAKKLTAFQEWLQQQMADDLISISLEGSKTTAYVRSAYKKAALDAYIKANPLKGGDFFKGGKAEFLRQAFDSPIALDRVELLATRSFENLKGITAQMSADLNRIFADGVAHGKNPKVIAREIRDNVTGIDYKRAKRIARTEIVHAYAEGSLDSYERLGIEEVSAMVEWSTAGDDRVCTKCQSRAGTKMKIAEARGLIPFHPNCRCAWIPYLPPKEKKTAKKKSTSTTKSKKKSKKKSST
jgi:SPP1 gp7 family putative phage head morphogenesis protein